MSAIATFRRLTNFGRLSERNLDAKSHTFYSLTTNMLFVLGSFVSFSIILGMAFILSKTVAKTRNKVGRFFFLFALCVLFNFVINYIYIWAFGYHKMSLTGNIIIALLLAGYGTFLPPQPHNPNAQ